MTRSMKTIRPRHAAESSASSSSTEATRTISASTPPAGVATLPPSAVRASFCDTGETTSPASMPRCHTGTVTGSARTLENPCAFRIDSPASTAAASPGDPASRGPERSTISRTHSKAREPAATRSRRPTAVWRVSEGIRAGATVGIGPNPASPRVASRARRGKVRFGLGKSRGMVSARRRGRPPSARTVGRQKH